MKTFQRFFTLLVVTIMLSACQSKQTVLVNIRFAEDDTLTRVKFHATTITGEASQEMDGETPYSREFSDQSFILIVTALPLTDSVQLSMEARDKTGSRAMGYAHAGALFHLTPHGGPGFVGMGTAHQQL